MARSSRRHAFCLAAAAASLAATCAAPSISVALVGYLPEWRYAGANFETLAAAYTHLIFFSAEPSPDGRVVGLDRLPPADVLADARAAAAKTGTALLLCFGGNGRSSGFSAMTRDAAARKRFIAAAVALVRDPASGGKGAGGPPVSSSPLLFDGLDINWEYPGGFSPSADTAADYDGLAALARGLRAALPAGAPLTAAYYPDGVQERHLVEHGVAGAVDLLHAMAYDAPGENHSPLSLARAALSRAAAAGLPAATFSLGVPFYGRSARTGDWVTYEDIVQRHSRAGAPLPASVDSVRGEDGAPLGFNGRATLRRKTRAAVKAGAGGVMVWEAGQSCRLAPVTRGGTTHVRTCPGEGAELELAAAIVDELRALGLERAPGARAYERRERAPGGGNTIGGGAEGGDL